MQNTYRNRQVTLVEDLRTKLLEEVKVREKAQEAISKEVTARKAFEDCMPSRSSCMVERYNVDHKSCS